MAETTDITTKLGESNKILAQLVQAISDRASSWDLSGVLPVLEGGTGVTSYADLITALGLNAAATSATVIKTVGRETIWMPATSLSAAAVSSAAVGTVATGDITYPTMDFDPTSTEYAWAMIRMPKSWNEGTVTAQFVWMHGATATNFGVVWQIAATAASNDDTGTITLSANQTIADTGGTTYDIYVSPETAALTIDGSPAAEDLVVVRIGRRPTDGSDTLAVDAHLLGMTLYFTSHAATDS